MGGLSVLAYRGTFLWRTRVSYLGNVFAMPILFVVQFAYFGEFAADEDAGRRLALAMCAYAVASTEISGVIQSSFYRTAYGVAELEALSRRSPAYRLASRTVAHIGNGILSFCGSLAVVWLLLGVSTGRAAWGATIVGVLALALGALGFAAVFAALVPFFKDWIILVIVANGLLTALSGVVIPVDALPWLLEALSKCLPVTHGIEAVLRALEGHTGAAFFGSCLSAVALGALYFAIAALVARRLEHA